MESPGKQRSDAAAGRDIDLRREERIEVALPVVFEESVTGMTVNVSSSGVLAETDQPIRLGMPVTMVIEFADRLGGPLRMKCEANILRMEELGERRRIAAALRWIAE